VLQPGDAYLYKAFTDPSVRGHRVQIAVGAFIVRYELEHGFKRHLFYVRHGNTPGFSVSRQFGPAAPHWNARRISVSLLGDVVTGLDRPNGLRWEFPPARRVRTLGRLGCWVGHSAAHQR
jgi:hypothetical protein